MSIYYNTNNTTITNSGSKNNKISKSEVRNKTRYKTNNNASNKASQ